jgi:ankyrin repeat protein
MYESEFEKKKNFFFFFFFIFTETPLTIVCTIKGHKCKEMVLTLVGGGAHIDFRNKKGMTALHKAVLVKNPTSVKVVCYKSYNIYIYK